MAEVKIIPGGTFSVEPQGPGWQGALPDCVPLPNPEIPFENYRTFFTPFKDGQLSPLAQMFDMNAGTGQTIIAPSPDKETSIKSVLPAPGDGSSIIAISPNLLVADRDAAHCCLKFKPTTPPPNPGQDFAMFFVLVSYLQNELFGVIYNQGLGQFYFIVQGTPTTFFPLVPYVQGDDYEIRFGSRPMLGGGLCLFVTVKQNGIITFQTTFPFAVSMRFPMVAGMRIDGATNVPAAMFEVIMKELSVGYQPLVTKAGGCP
jgi:hypothetical protein